MEVLKKMIGYLKCLSCGRTPRRVDLENKVFTVPLKCRDCGGSVVIDTTSTFTIFKHNNTVGEDDKPRRGRPPKWLVEQRHPRGFNSV